MRKVEIIHVGRAGSSCIEIPDWMPEDVFDYGMSYSGYGSFEEFVDNCVHFMSMTFSKALLQERVASMPNFPKGYMPGWTEMDLIYKTVYEELPSRHLGQSPILEDRHPLVYAGLNFQRSHDGFGGEGPLEDFHMHALWVIPPQDCVKFRHLVDGTWFSNKISKLAIDQVGFWDGGTAQCSVEKFGQHIINIMSQSSWDPVKSKVLRVYPCHGEGRGLPAVNKVPVINLN